MPKLAAAMPEAGGEYVSQRGVLDPFTVTSTADSILVAKSGSIATLAAGFYTYLTALSPRSPPCAGHAFPHRPGGTLSRSALRTARGHRCHPHSGAVNYAGVRSGGNVQVFVTVIR